MIKLILLLFFIAAIVIIILLLKNWLVRKSRVGQVYACACGCGRPFTAAAGWDGYHGPDFDNPIIYDAQMLQEKARYRAIDRSDDYVLGWKDIEWTVERRLPKEG